jgi:hypothetical protein
MRHVVFLDNKISDKEYQKWTKEDTIFWEKYIGVTPTYEVIRTDYTTYPTFVDSDKDIRPTDAYLKSLNDIAVKRYGEFGYDFAMVMVHEDNWKSDTDTTKGIWGTNYSYTFGKQCLDYCRWDKDNPANTFGTAYHERHHSFDAIIKQELGVNIEPILNVTGYDKSITHGGSFPWLYIRHQENIDSLRIMKPYLQQAFQKRLDRHTEVLGLMETVISLASKVIYLLKMQKNRKNGVSSSLK